MDEADAKAGARCLWRSPVSLDPAIRSTRPDRRDRLVIGRWRGLAVHALRGAGSAQRIGKRLISGGGGVLSRSVCRRRTGTRLVKRDTAPVAARRERYLDTGRALRTLCRERGCAGRQDRHAALPGRLSRLRYAKHSAATAAGTKPSRDAALYWNGPGGATRCLRKDAGLSGPLSRKLGRSPHANLAPEERRVGARLQFFEAEPRHHIDDREAARCHIDDRELGIDPLDAGRGSQRIGAAA